MSSSTSSAFIDQSNKWRDVDRVAVLNKNISEVDIYSNAPSPNKWVEFFGCGGCCFPRSPFARVFDTSQLQYLLALEKELDSELRKPLEYSQDEYCASDYLSAIFVLQKRISELEKETEGITIPYECCSTKFSIPMSTNLLLLKNILEIRLEREKRKERVTNVCTYGSISKPIVDLSSTPLVNTEEQERKRQKIENWKKELLKLKSTNPYNRERASNFDQLNVRYYIHSLYIMTKEQDLKSKIKRSTTITENDPPPYTK